MDAMEVIKGRRSVRKFKDEKVDRETMKKIIELARYAPSWANFQVARYTLVENEATIKELVTDGVHGFVYNVDTLKNAKGVAVLSHVEGKSGKLDPDKDEYATPQADVWEIFDSGIACQTFCLSAYAHGVATCVMGVINDTTIAKIVNLPADEKVSALIVYGYEEGEHAKPTPRKSVDELARFID